MTSEVSENPITHLNIFLLQTQLAPHAKGFEVLCMDFLDIFSQHKGDFGHTELITMDTEMGEHHPIAQMPYILPLKHTQ